MQATARSATSTVAVLAALAMSLSACGGGSGAGSGRSAEDTQAARALSSSIMKSQTGGGATSLVEVTRKQADCIGTGMVDKVGTADLKKYKILTGDLKPGTDVTGATMSAADAQATTEVFFGCADVEAMVKKAVDGSGSLTGAVKTCVDQALSGTALRAFLTSTFQGKTTAAQTTLTQRVTTCAQKAR